MLTVELIGKKITNIYEYAEFEQYGLDKGEAFIELDNSIIIRLPFAHDDEINKISGIKELSPKAWNIFKEAEEKPKKGLALMLAKIFPKLYTKKTFVPNPIEPYILHREIVDIVWCPDDVDYAFLLLDSGYLVSEMGVAPHGTGLTGVFILRNLEEFIKCRGVYRSLKNKFS